MPDVSVVMPVRNGAAWLDRTLSALVAQVPRAELLIVDDGSADDSMRIVERYAGRYNVRVVGGPRRGAAAALNVGVIAASHELIVQIDQDVEVLPGWIQTVLPAFDLPRVGAVQACYVPDTGAPLIARVMALDLALRYERLETTNHVCTGNTAYRRSALYDVGLFDDRLGYGYDNDISYRLVGAGWGLRIMRDARSFHCWRYVLADYLAQQYGFGYGRLELVAKHPRRIAGDAVSPAWMMAHPLVLGAAGLLLVAAGVLQIGAGAGRPLVAGAASLVGALAAERLLAGIKAARRYRDWAGLLFPLVHLARDGAWVAAIVVWIVRQACGWEHLPAHSMRPRPARATTPAVHSTSSSRGPSYASERRFERP